MSREIELEDLDILDELSYPVARTSAESSLDDVVLVLPDRDVNVGEIVAELPSESFSSTDDLELELLRNVATQTAQLYEEE